MTTRGTRRRRALHAAHEAGLVSGDVTPGDLLVGADGAVTVTDVGLAATVSASRCRGALEGTAGYRSSEHAAGADGTTASDLCALGVVAHECPCGRTPFVADPAVAVPSAHVSIPPPALPPDVPLPVRALVRSVLPEDPAHRPTSAAVVAARAAELQSQLSSDPPATGGRRAGAGHGVTSRRTQRSAVRVTAVLLVLLAVVLGRGSWGGDAAPAPGTAQIPPVPAGQLSSQDVP